MTSLAIKLFSLFYFLLMGWTELLYFRLMNPWGQTDARGYWSQEFTTITNCQLQLQSNFISSTVIWSKFVKPSHQLSITKSFLIESYKRQWHCQNCRLQLQSHFISSTTIWSKVVKNYYNFKAISCHWQSFNRHS